MGLGVPGRRASAAAGAANPWRPCDHCPRRAEGGEDTCPCRFDPKLGERTRPGAVDADRWRTIVRDLPPYVPGRPYDVEAHNAAIGRHSPSPAVPEPAPGREPEPAREPDLPSLAHQVGGFLRSAGSVLAGAAADVVNGRMPSPLLDDAGYGARLAICRDCDHYRPSDHRCGMMGGCGCFLADHALSVGVTIPGKARYRDVVCPIGKW